jgi:hypothetical protein
MTALTNTILGLGFLLTGSAATFLMYHLWGYPFDHEKLKSSAPPRLMLLHGCIGLCLRRRLIIPRASGSGGAAALPGG